MVRQRGHFAEELQKKAVIERGYGSCVGVSDREDELFARVSECPDEVCFFPSSRNVYPNLFASRFP